MIGNLNLQGNLNRAILIALYAHEGQTDKTGRPYIEHVLRVGLASGPDEDTQTAGFLHDVVEDSPITLNSLGEVFDFPIKVVNAVDALTRRDGETYRDYLRRLAKNDLALRVKKADLKDNLDSSRQEFEGAEDLQRRHSQALAFINEELVLRSYDVAQRLTPPIAA